MAAPADPGRPSLAGGVRAARRTVRTLVSHGAAAIASLTVAGCTLSPPRVPATAETVATVARESSLVAVHDHDVVAAHPAVDGQAPHLPWMYVAAPREATAVRRSSTRAT